MLPHVNDQGIKDLIDETFNMCEYLNRIDEAQIN
jgi:hypothetical protein